MGATCDQVIITFVDLFLVFHENCVGFVKRRSVIFYMHKYAARRILQVLFALSPDLRRLLVHAVSERRHV